MTSDEVAFRLVPLLEDARSKGLVGPGPVLPHLDHAMGFSGALGALDGLNGWDGTGRALDLGSGAGLPGLPLALTWPDSQWVLLESGARRARFLVGAVESLGLGARVRVAEGRAEVLAHDVELRRGFGLVVARGFGLPAVTAECAAGFLAVGGWLVVSEPPGGRPQRWVRDGLARVGMEAGPSIMGRGSSYQAIRQSGACPDGFPRRTGVPSKRPLFVTQ